MQDHIGAGFAALGGREVDLSTFAQAVEEVAKKAGK